MDAEKIWPLVHGRMREFLGQTWDIAVLGKVGNAKPGTVGEWIIDSRPPNGERLIRLWHFFAVVGFDSPELSNIGALSRYLGLLMTADVIAMPEVMEALGVQNSQTALQILRGTQPMHPHKTVEELKRDYGEILDGWLAALPMIDRSNGSAPEAQAERAEPVRPSSSVLAEGTLNLAMQLSGALPAMRHLVSDSCTPGQRSAFRRLVGDEALFEVANLSGALCSERARKQAR